MKAKYFCFVAALPCFIYGGAPVFESQHSTPVFAAVISTGRPAGVPSNAVSSGDLAASSNWNEGHDGGTKGSSKGSTRYPVMIAGSNAREFYMTYTDQGGERWSNTFARNSAESTHFMIDGYVYLTQPSQVLNLETDINDVDSAGNTYILSTQCAGTVGTWEYGYTVGKKTDHWWSVSNMRCNPAQWGANKWHHIQIAAYRNNDGTTTHEWVALDGVTQNWVNATKMSSHYLGWSKGEVNTQYQIEGASTGSGSITSYIHDWVIWRW
jgi:hypothetical protein